MANRVILISFGLVIPIVIFLFPVQIHPLALATNASVIQVSVAHAFGLDAMWSYILTHTLSLFISIAASLLTFAGAGFNAVINYTIIDFSYNFAPLQNGIYAAWAVFRNLGNIILIAMFVYLAFNVMLDMSTYGLKKFGIRIVMVALLINFSLFFTKAIIDISNITAITFYKSITIARIKPPSISNKTTSVNTRTATTTIGIANVFMQSAGISSIFDTSGTIKNIIKNKDGGSGKAFMYTLIVVIFFMALSGVFIFALILLITRMVAFIILLPLSALAFSAYIIPGGEELWKKWWGALIKNALFAPVFMALLWGVIQIIESPQISARRQPLQLDKLLINQGVWSAVFMMIIIISLLYAATTIANHLSLRGAGMAKKYGVRATGLGYALKGAVAIRNNRAKYAAQHLGKVPGFRKIAAQLNQMSQTKLENTALGKGLSKQGMSFTTDQSTAIAKHQVEMYRKEEGQKVVTKSKEDVSSLKELETTASSMKTAAETELESVRTRTEHDDAADSEHMTTAQKVKQENTLKLHEEERRANDSSLAKSTRRNARAEAAKAEAEIARQDSNIAELTKNIQSRQQTLSTHKTKVDSAHAELTNIRDRITTTQSDKYKNEQTNINIKARINDSFLMGKSVRTIALAKYNQTPIDKLSEAVSKLKDTSDKKGLDKLSKDVSKLKDTSDKKE